MLLTIDTADVDAADAGIADAGANADVTAYDATDCDKADLFTSCNPLKFGPLISALSCSFAHTMN